VRQPATVTALATSGGRHDCQITSVDFGPATQITAPVVIAAHGSWETGSLPTQPTRPDPRQHDLLAFKAHFHNSRLPSDLMPLLSFPDGYGGMVHTDGGRISLSCCVRRDRLERFQRQAGQSAGEAVLEHILQHNTAARSVLEHAAVDGRWLAAGPIRPGQRACYQHDIFCIGNAAGEAHPVVAEGISMAMQSAWLLADLLLRRRVDVESAAMRRQLGAAYASAWRRHFMPRICAAAIIAHWAMRPRFVGLTLPAIWSCPQILTCGATLSGKVARLHQHEELASR
jgi:flavin-dependent dehydrogenase